MKTKIIEQYEAQSAQLRAVITGLTRADLLAFPIPGTWSIQQIVIHMSDSDVIGVDRMKRIIAEEKPLLIGYNETSFSKALFYDDQSIDNAITLLELSRSQLAIILRKMPDTAWDRIGIHNEIGKVSLGEMLEKYIRHFDHHLGFIAKKRKLLGK